MTLLPEVELDAFLITVTDAVDAAADGKAADGYTMLLAGLARAREADEDGEPWAPELVKRYEEARERFAERWGIARE